MIPEMLVFILSRGSLQERRWYNSSWSKHSIFVLKPKKKKKSYWAGFFHLWLIPPGRVEDNQKGLKSFFHPIHPNSVPRPWELVPGWIPAKSILCSLHLLSPSITTSILKALETSANRSQHINIPPGVLVGQALTGAWLSVSVLAACSDINCVCHAT